MRSIWMSFVVFMTLGCGDRPMPITDDSGAGACQISAGHWVGSGSVDPSSTDPDCAMSPVDGRFATLEEAVALGMCQEGCSCSMSPPELPACAASAGSSCEDGSSLGIVAQRSDPMTVGYAVTLTSATGLTCTVNGMLVWVEP